MKPLRLAAQALSVVLVVGLLGLLVWKVAHQVGHTTIASEVRREAAARPVLLAPAARRRQLDSAPSKKGRRDQLLGVVVHPVP